MFKYIKKLDLVVANLLGSLFAIYLIITYGYSHSFLGLVVGFIVVTITIFIQATFLLNHGRFFKVIYFSLCFALLCFFLRMPDLSGYLVINAEGLSSCPTICQDDMAVVKLKNLELTRGKFVVVSLNENLFVAKRIHGMPGDRIRICNENVYVNDYNYLLSHGWTGRSFAEESCIESDEFMLRDGEYYVLGDNVEFSIDSKSFGIVRERQITGNVLYKFGEKYGLESVNLNVVF